MDNKQIFKIFIFILFCISSIACTKTTNDSIIASWDLIKKSGGIAGVNESYNRGDISWTFSETSLLIENNLTSESTNTPYTIQESNNESFLKLNNFEFGMIILKNDELEIDQNQKSTGSGADGFVFEFKLSN